jgi:dienelactone hydrolase
MAGDRRALAGAAMRVSTIGATAMVAALMAGRAALATLPPPERVAFDSIDLDANGAPVRLAGLLYRPPEPAPAGGFPAVIALHGCGGLYSAAAGREDEISARHAAWAQELIAEGFAVLFPDSFRPRGLRDICTIAVAKRPLGPARRRLDALAALAWLAAASGIDRERIALLGFSHGGSTTLATINARDRAVRAYREAAGVPFFRAAVAFYPGCRTYLDAGERWRPAVPARIHIGANDDWTPAAPCALLGEVLALRGEPLEVTVYPDSYHGFDAPGGRRIVRKDVPGGVNPGQGVTVAPNPAAGVEARAKTRAFLRERLAPAVASDPARQSTAKG